MKTVKRIASCGVLIAVILVALNIAHNAPPHQAKGQFPILADWSFFPFSIAANLNQAYPPHGYYGEGAQCGGSGGFGSCFSGNPALSAATLL
jgi:hypothetical protein